MVNCGRVLKSVLVAIVLVALNESGAAPEKPSTCCKEVTRQEITDPILGYLVHSKPTAPCVKAVILQTEKGLFCVYLRAPWVGQKIKAFEQAKRQTTFSPSVAPSQVSLLSIITSTASPSSSSTPLSTSLPSFSSTSKMPVSKNFSEDDN